MRFITLLVLVVFLLNGCGPAPTPTPEAAPGGVPIVVETEMEPIHDYFLDKVKAVKQATTALRATGDAYYARVNPMRDYAALWQTDRAALIALVQDGQAEWLALTPLYAQAESIVAGVPVLARYNLILRVGTPGAAGGTATAPYDLTLPDGRVLAQPGNLFSIIERTLWGGAPDYAAPGVVADFDGDGTQEPGETLPDAIVLKGALDALDDYAEQLLYEAQVWQPMVVEAFTVLVTLLPTVSTDLGTWKSAPAIAGTVAPELAAPPISRLSEAQATLGTLLVVYGGVSSHVRSLDPAQDSQLAGSLRGLHDLVADINSQEQAGKQYTLEEADLLESDVGDQVVGLTGQLSQVMAQLGMQALQGTAACSGVVPAATPVP